MLRDSLELLQERNPPVDKHPAGERALWPGREIILVIAFSWLDLVLFLLIKLSASTGFRLVSRAGDRALS